MRFLFVVLTCLSMTAMGQSKAPQVYVNASVSPQLTAGKFDNKSFAAGEIGLKVKKVRIGVAVGTTSLSKGNCFTEVRVTPTFWESGNFSVNGTLGGGIVWTSRNFMMEYGASVGYTLPKLIIVYSFRRTTYRFPQPSRAPSWQATFNLREGPFERVDLF